MVSGYRQGILGENRHKLSAIFRGTTLSPAVPLKKLAQIFSQIAEILKIISLVASGML